MMRFPVCSHYSAASPNKIKPIPRHPSCSISSPTDLKVLQKKGIKTKRLAYIEEETLDLRNKLPNMSKNQSQLKRVLKYNRGLLGIEAKVSYRKDISALLKIQDRIRNIKSLKMHRIVLNDRSSQKNFQRFLLRSKHLKSYNNNPETIILPSSYAQCVNPQVCFTFYAKKNGVENYNENRPSRFLVGLRKRFPSLVSMCESRDSMSFAINLPFDTKRSEFDRKLDVYIRQFRPFSLHCDAMLPPSMKNEVNRVLPILKARNINVKTHLNLDRLKEENDKELIERFLSKKDVKFLVWPNNYSWQSIIEMLTFSQQIFLKFGSYFGLANFVFSLHAPTEVKKAMILHFKEINFKWEQVTFAFKTNSVDWFNEEKRACLGEMTDEMLKEENRKKYSQINFDIDFTADFSKRLLAKIFREIVSIIQWFVQKIYESKGPTRFLLNLSLDVRDRLSLFSFADYLKEISLHMNHVDLRWKSTDKRNVALSLERVRGVRRDKQVKELGERLSFKKFQRGKQGEPTFAVPNKSEQDPNLEQVEYLRRSFCGLFRFELELKKK